MNNTEKLHETKNKLQELRSEKSKIEKQIQYLEEEERKLQIAMDPFKYLLNFER